MYDSEHKIEMCTVEVQVTLDDGTEFLGYMFVRQMQRISDLLNDPRQFLPIRTSAGLILHIRKSTIAKIMHLDQEVGPDAAMDPYEILGVSTNIGDSDLKQTYYTNRQKIKDSPSGVGCDSLKRLIRSAESICR